MNANTDKRREDVGASKCVDCGVVLDVDGASRCASCAWRVLREGFTLAGAESWLLAMDAVDSAGGLDALVAGMDAREGS
jgi:hypothetical protein